MKLGEFSKDSLLSELRLPSAQQVGAGVAKAQKAAVGAGKAAAAITKFMAQPKMPGANPNAPASPAAQANATADAASDIKADMAEKKKEIQELIRQKEKELMDLRQTMNQIK